MEGKELNNLEMSDDQLDSVAGGVGRQVSENGMCPMCGQRLRPVMVPLGTSVAVPKNVCNSCDYAEW